MKTHRWRYVVPLSLIGLAVLLTLGMAFRPNPVIDLGPIDLAPGTTKRVTFRPGYAETYAIGVRMSRKAAERLYPCTVSEDAMQKPECKSRASSWPVALAIKGSSDGRDLTSVIEPSASLAGGEYEGAGAYTWIAAHIRLVPGTIYHLDVRSIGRASSLSSAHPHLVVSAAGAPGLLENNALKQTAALFIGILLVASAALWAVMNSPRRHPTAA